MSNKEFIAVILAMLAILISQYIGYRAGFNGTVATTAIAAISGLSGYIVKASRDKMRGKK